MSVTAIGDIFNCQVKLMEHDHQHRKYYNDNAAPAMIREAIMNLVKSKAQVNQANLAIDDECFKEVFKVTLPEGILVTTGMNSRRPTCIKTCTIRSPSTLVHYNKLVSYIHSIFEEGKAQGIISFLDSVISLTRKGYVFECYIEPKYMSLKLESTRTKLNVDVDLEIV